MDRVLRWLTDDEPRGRWWGLLPRLAIAAIMLPAGLGKFFNYDAYVERFERWGFGAAPGLFALLTGTAEVLAALLVLSGRYSRLGALTIIGVMIGALATAGRVDGGQNLWLPVVVIGLAVLVAALGSGPLRIGGRRGTSRRHSLGTHR